MSSADQSNIRDWLGDNVADIATLGVLFTDMVDSTFLANEIGDDTMNQIRDAHFATVESLCKVHDGFVVTDLGDGYLIIFRSVIQGLDFALKLREAPGHELVTIHAGLSIGPVTLRNNTVHGVTVNLAARLEGAAQSNEIYVCRETKLHIDHYRAPDMRRYRGSKSAAD